MRPWLVRVASESKDVAKRILETDLEQLIMILTTLVAAVVYGWIEGAIIVAGCIGRICDWAGPQGWWLFGHFSTYSVAMLILFSCITGGFGLVKGRSMFAKGKRYFLFTFAGNMPFCAMIEDFTFFFFNTSETAYRLSLQSWTNWFLGGFQVQDPWREGVKLWIPAWYMVVLIFWIAMMWIAHSCTVYDNLVKDEIGKQLIPKAETPIHVEPKAELQPQPAEKVETAPKPVTETKPAEPKVEAPQPRSKPAGVSIEAEEALKKLRARALKRSA